MSDVLKEINNDDLSKIDLKEFEDRSSHFDRRVDRGIINENTGSAIGIRENGDTIIASNTNAQYKLSHDTNSSTEITMQSNTITNRKNIMADEVILNNHKLNPKIYELADIKELFEDKNKAIGNLNVMGTVLVKAWEPSLGKYVLIRRQIRLPLFSQDLNAADAPEQFSINTNPSEELKSLQTD
jgi:hypothetical protein